MFLKNKSRFKPLYKKFISLRENVQNRDKLFNFKKKKWKEFKKATQKKLKWYKKFRAKDQVQYIVSRYPSRWFSYTQCYKNMLINNKKLKLLYGGLPKKYIKKQVWKILKSSSINSNINFLHLFETRLDVTLYRAKFSTSIRSARQFILHNKVFVNNKSVQSGSYLLKPGDLIQMDLRLFSHIRWNARKSSIWPLPPKHLFINYKTLQIFFGSFGNANFSLNFLYHLNLEKIIASYYQN